MSDVTTAISDLRQKASSWVTGDIAGIWEIDEAIGALLLQAQRNEDRLEDIQSAVRDVCRHLRKQSLPTLPEAKLYYHLAMTAVLTERWDISSVRESLQTARYLMELVSADLDKHGVKNNVRSTISLVETQQAEVEWLATGNVIFDALGRMNVTVRWHEKSIIVLDKVTINPPYRPEDCKGAPEHVATLERVKRVVEVEQTRGKVDVQSADAPASGL